MVGFALPFWLPLSVLAWAAHMAVYHGGGLAFEWCDRRGKLRRFKVRRTGRRGYAEMLPRVLFNQCIILLPCLVACQMLGLAFVGASHLGVSQFLISLLLMGLGHDLVQYVAHRWVLHSRLFSWLGHRLHHSSDADSSISACFMTPADFFLEIVCPYVLPLVLIGGGGSDVLFQVLVPSLGAIGGLYEHSGYDFSIAWGTRAAVRASLGLRLIAWLPAALVSSHAHGEHHRLGTVSFSDGFGSPGLCDAIFGTRWDARRRPPSRASSASR